MPTWEYGLKTGNLSEEEMVKCFEKALTRAAKATSPLTMTISTSLTAVTGAVTSLSSFTPIWSATAGYNSPRRGLHGVCT